MSYTLKRRLEWWREEGEDKLLEQEERRKMKAEEELKKRLLEKLELKRGSDGKNPEPIMKGKLRSKKLTKEQEKAILKRKLKELESDVDDEEKLSLEDMEISVDKDDEITNDDVQEVEVDEVEGGYCSCPKCGARLVIELADEEEDEEEEGEEEFEDEEFEGEEETPEDTVEAENRDISAKQLEKQKRKIYMKRALAEEESEFGVEWGSDTDDMVISGRPSSGKKMRGGEPESDEDDLDFGIDPQDTDDMVGKGRPMDGGKAITTDSNSRMPERRRAFNRNRVAEEEIVEPQQDEFESEDTLEDLLGDDDYANIPLRVGGKEDAVSRIKAVEERRKLRNRQTESKWKQYIKGRYK